MENKVKKYNNYYIINIDEKMKNLALNFAKKIIKTNNQYSRLLPNGIDFNKDKERIEIQRTFLGKLGEIAFLTLLTEKNIDVKTDGMFDVFEGQNNVDSFDFITTKGKSIDIKTGFRSIHTRLLINIEQFNNIPKDFYVAVKIETADLDSSKKIIDINSIKTAKIIGYADYTYLKKYAKVGNFGEAYAKYIPYEKLLNIDRLIKLF